MLHDPANFPVLAFPYREHDPHIVALLALERGFDRAVIHAVRSQARSKLIQFRLLDLPEGTNAITPGPTRGREFEMPREIAVVREKEKTLRIEVEPAHRNQPGQVLRQGVEDGRPSLGVFVRRHPALRLVKAPKPGRLPHRERLPIDKHFIRRRNIERGAFYDRAIHGHTLFPNQDFGVPPRAKP